MNAWLKRCVFNLDLNSESVSEPRTLSGRLFQSLGAKYEKALPPLVDFAILLPRVQSFATLETEHNCLVDWLSFELYLVLLLLSSSS